MSTPLERKRAENEKTGDEALAKAQKLTKKTLTRWKPDWEAASRYYRDAVKAYKLCDNDQKTIQACRESAIAHDELGQFLTTATDLETAASLMAKDSGKEEKKKEAFDCYRESGLNYRKNNSYEKAAAMYVKAAEVMEGSDVELALEALKDACAIFEDEQRGQFHDSTFKKAIQSAIKYGKMEEAIAFMKRQNALVKDQQLMQTFANDVYKNYLQILVLCYHLGELDRAREELEQAEQANDKFIQSEQFPAAQALLDAYEEGDSEKLTEALKLSPFKYINNSIAVIARKLQMKEAKRVAKKKPTRPTNAAAAAAAEEAAEEEKDEDDFT